MNRQLALLCACLLCGCAPATQAAKPTAESHWPELPAATASSMPTAAPASTASTASTAKMINAAPAPSPALPPTPTAVQTVLPATMPVVSTATSTPGTAAITNALVPSQTPISLGHDADMGEVPGPDLDMRQTEFGIQINGCDKDIEETFGLLHGMHLTWIKQQARWADIEKAPGVYDWRCLDTVVAAAERDGYRVPISITTSPAFRRKEFIALGQHATSGRPDRMEDFGHFVFELASRYVGKIHALELWNEPNLIIEWGDTLDAVNYVTLLKLGYQAAKQVDPSLLVISAGIAPSAFNSLWTHVDDTVFFKTALEAGLAKTADCIGAHANGPDGSGDIDAVASRYFTLSADALPICVTEFGHAIPVNGRTPPGFEWAMAHTEASQVQALGDGLRWAKSAGYVRLVIVWNLNYDGGDAPNTDPNAIYALTRPGWRSPALQAIAEISRGRQKAAFVSASCTGGSRQSKSFCCAG